MAYLLNSLAKPSRPARAYLHLTEQAFLQELSESVQQATFTDAKNTGKDPALVGPPVLEFAPFSRVPTTDKKRVDARQGTIDQDPEFIEFLQGLTNPIQKPTGEAEAAVKKEAPKTTPLIEAIREKKAAKEKPGASRSAASAAGKHGRQENKEPKASDKSDKKPLAKTPKEIQASPEKGKRMTKAEKAAKEAVKVLNREASGATQASAQASAQSGEKSAAGPGTAAAERRRDRVANPLSVAAKIQRDLGLAPAGPKRPKREQVAVVDTPSNTDAADSTTAADTSAPPKRDPRTPRGQRVSKGSESSSDAVKKTPTGPATPTILKKPATQPQLQPPPPKGPATGRAPPIAPKAAVVPTGPASESASTPTTPTTSTTTGRQAFLKHANPSQGITETLIEEALKVFGGIEKVEIDRKKGFAYVDFADAEALRKAIAGSPVKIAQGAVQVLERRERLAGRGAVAPMPVARGGFRGGRGGRGRGGRGGIAATNPVPTTTSTPTPATAPQTASSGAAT